MLFNSYFFIFIFLPITLLGFYLIGARGKHAVASAWLVGASLFFYGWWNPAYLGLIIFSILLNYSIGLTLRNSARSSGGGGGNKALLAVGVIINIAIIGYFKYANFFVDSVNAGVGSSFHLDTIILPLAISFFTFQQIAYLVDAYSGITEDHNFLHYCLFVTFFPQLIAGPIVHHKEMMPQFDEDKTYRFNTANISIGLTILMMGLFKKVVIADNIATYSTIVFNAAENGATITFFEAWAGALSYTFQLYFDFSGYSDMAIGLARLFGIRLPLNFNSPYKAYNIIEFWRRWHITLSRFFRDYIYIPLGGSRAGTSRIVVNLMITMTLGGLWHGAGWTFVFWGALHGIYLAINHAWRLFREKALGHDLTRMTLTGRIVSTIITFLAVVVSWVFFRAESFGAATSILKGMVGASGVSFYTKYLEKFGDFALTLQGLGVKFSDYRLFEGDDAGYWILAGVVIAWVMPNTAEIMRGYDPALNFKAGPETGLRKLIRWEPTIPWAIVSAIVCLFAITSLIRVSEFLYFQF